MRNIVLVGFMGTGKTSTGKYLAASLKRDFLELDEIIEKKEGMAIRDIFQKKGEPYFRSLEKKVVREASCRPGAVISAGGGAVIDEDNIYNLKKNGIMICLKASPEVILERTKGLKNRPLLNVSDPMARIKDLLEERMPYYEKADIFVDTDGLTPEEVGDKIISLIEGYDG